MRFDVVSDEGHIIRGWVTPDNPMQIPRVIVHASGLEAVEIQASIVQQDILEHGLHSTGVVGFEVSEQLMPGLAEAEIVEIFEAETKLCIYRRLVKSKNIQKKFFLFDAAVMPQRSIINNINKHFATRHNAIERHGYETIFYLVHNYFPPSIFLTGRPQFSRWGGALRGREFTIAALLRNPFEELAERMLFLNLAAKSSAAGLLGSFMTGLEPVLDLARDLKFEDKRALQATFRNLTPDQRLALGNPMTRMLAGNLDERIERRHVTTALDNLSQMDAVGIRTRFVEFSQMVADILGTNVVGNAELETFQTIDTLTDQLSRVSAVVDLLEHDLALFSFAEEAVETGLGLRQSA